MSAQLRNTDGKTTEGKESAELFLVKKNNFTTTAETIKCSDIKTVPKTDFIY